MCTYLAKRGATYYFRRVIPADLRPAIGGRAEFMVSLRTKDREQAKRLIPAQTAASDREMDAARSRMPANCRREPAEPQSARAAAWEQAAWEHAQEGAEIEYREEAERQERWEAREPIRLEVQRAFRKSTAELTPREAAMRDLLRDAEYRAMAAEERAAIARDAQRAIERRGFTPSEVVTTAASPVAQVAQLKKSGVDLARIVELWAAERKPRPKTRDAYAAVARWFDARRGAKPVASIAKADVLGFKDALVREGVTPANINTKLDRLSTLMQWATLNDHAATNPVQGIRVVDADRGSRRPRPFDLASLNRIFASPVYAAGERPVQGRGEAAYWLPILALFAGARLEELGQLRPGDVERVVYADGEGADASAWIIHITTLGDDGMKLKNAGSERDVPVHPELERLGFIAFAEAAQKAKQARLLPDLRPDKYGRLTAKWGEWWSRYRRERCGITDRRMRFHSFRNTFKDYARHAGIPEGVQRQLMGHTSGDVADSYGSGHFLHQLVEGTRSRRTLVMTVTALSL